MLFVSWVMLHDIVIAHLNTMLPPGSVCDDCMPEALRAETREAIAGLTADTLRMTLADRALAGLDPDADDEEARATYEGAIDSTAGMEHAELVELIAEHFDGALMPVCSEHAHGGGCNGD